MCSWPPGGWPFPADPGLDIRSARPVWRADWDPRVLLVDALPADRAGPDAFDIGHYPCAQAVHGTCETLLFADGPRMLRLDVREGTFFEGPVRLRYAIEGFRELSFKLLSLRRLMSLRRLGRLPTSLYPADSRAGRWILILRCLDGLAAGASQREIATALFGAERTRADWRTETDYLRLKVQRLVRTARALLDGGYRRLLRSRPDQ